MKAFFKSRKNKSITLALIILLGTTITLVGTHTRYLDFAVLVYTIVALASFIPVSTLIDFLSARLIISILLSAAFFQLEGLFFWLIHWHVTPIYYLLGLFWVVHICILFLSTGSLLNRLKPRALDAMIVGAGLLLCSATLVGVFRHSGINQTSVVQSLGFGLDDGSHLSMLSDEYRSGDNLLLGGQDSTAVTFSGFSAYPKGWHLTTAIYTSFLLPFGQKSPKPIILMDAYFIAKLATLFLTICLISLCIYAYSRKDAPHNKHSIHTGFFASLTALLITIILIYPLYWAGFFSFLPAVIFGLLFGLIVIAAERDASPFIFIYLALAVAGSALSWLLAAPSLLLSMLLMLPKLNIKQITSYIISNSIALICVVLAVVVICIQSTAQIFYNSGLQAFSANGGIIPTANAFALVIFVGFFAFIFSTDRLSIKRTLSWISPVFALTILVLLYELLKGPSASYYYYKLEILILVLMAVPACAILIDQVSKFSAIKQGYTYWIPSTLLMMVLGAVLISSLSFNDTSLTLRQVSGSARQTSSQDAQIIIRDSLSKNFNENHNKIFFIFPNDPPRGIINSHLARIAHPISSCDNRLFNDNFAGLIDKFSSQLKTCLISEPNHYFVYTDTFTKQRLLAELDELHLGRSSLSIKTIN